MIGFTADSAKVSFAFSAYFLSQTSSCTVLLYFEYVYKVIEFRVDSVRVSKLY